MEVFALILFFSIVVLFVIYDKKTKKAKGVMVIDSETNETMEFYAKIVFVNGSTLGSTFVLLNSTSEAHPNGLGNGSGQLGHNLMDHHFRCGAEGTVEGFEDKYTYGRRANGIYIPRYQNFKDDKRDYLRGFGYQGAASRGHWHKEVAELDFGGDFKEILSRPAESWTMGLGGFGEMLPYYENKVYIDHSKKDKWGQPVLAIDCEYKENEAKMREDMMYDAAEMLEAAGAKNVKAYDNGCYPGMTIHEMGTDPKKSVLNKWNQMHEVSNVFVTDGSCMPSSACQNPSLTYMALTARAVDYAVKELKKKNI